MRERQSEQRALELLKKHFQEYKGLVSSDKPDLIDRDNSIGVEVTSALNPKVEEREVHFAEKMKSRDKSEFAPREIAEVEKYGLRIVSKKNSEDGNMLGLVRVFGLEELEQVHIAIKKKYKKKYEELDRIDLYIFFRQICRKAISDSKIKSLFCTAYNCEKEHGKVFRKIMIDFYGVLLIMDLENNCVEELTDYK